jgi:hypothetical protein
MEAVYYDINLKTATIVINNQKEIIDDNRNTDNNYCIIRNLCTRG